MSYCNQIPFLSVIRIEVHVLGVQTHIDMLWVCIWVVYLLDTTLRQSTLSKLQCILVQLSRRVDIAYNTPLEPCLISLWGWGLGTRLASYPGHVEREDLITFLLHIVWVWDYAGQKRAVQGWCVCVSCSTAVCGAGDLVKVYTWCEGGDGGGGGRSDVQHAVWLSSCWGKSSPESVSMATKSYSLNMQWVEMWKYSSMCGSRNRTLFHYIFIVFEVL